MQPLHGCDNPVYVRVSRPVVYRDPRPWVQPRRRGAEDRYCLKGTCATTAGAGRCLCCATTSQSTSVPPTSVGRPCARSTAATSTVHATCWARWRPNWPRTGRVRKPGCSGSWRARRCSPSTSLRWCASIANLPNCSPRSTSSNPRASRPSATAVFDLYEHISKEEDGLFPASLTALGGDEWDAAMDAWHEAHPGRRMIQG